MKILKKTPQLLLRQQKRKRFSRLDTIVLLFLAVCATYGLLLNIFAPAPAAHTSPGTLAMVSHMQNQAQAPQGPRRPCLDSVNCDGSSTCADLSCSQDPTNFQTTSTIPSPLGAGDTLFFFTRSDITVDQSDVRTIWGIVLGIVDAFMVLLLVLTGLRIMMGGSVFRHAAALEVLPEVLLAFIAAQLSLNIAGIFLSANNTMSVALYNESSHLQPTPTQLNGQDIITKTCNDWLELPGAGFGATIGVITPFGQVLGGVLGGIIGHQIGCDSDPHVVDWQQTLQKLVSPPNITQGGSLGGLFTAIQAVSDLLKFITGIMVLILLGQLIVRLFFIDFYIILAPLGIGAWALPGRAGHAAARLWLSGFLSTVFAQFVQVAGLIVLRLLIGAITSAIYASFHNSAINNDPTLLWVIQIAQYWFLIRLPALLGTAPTNMLVQFGNAVSQVVSTGIAITVAEVQFATTALMSTVGLAGLATGR